MCLLNSGKDKMLVKGDFDLNSVQRYHDSLEGFKQTMVNQEVMFKKQVHELHRLYGVQKTLMKDVDCKEFDGYNSRKASAQSSSMPIRNPTKYEPQAKKTRFSAIPMVSSMLPLSQELLEGCHDIRYKLQQGPLDLQLPADQYISLVDKNLPEKKYVFCGDNILDPIELKLSLSLGEDNRREVSMKKFWFDKKTHSCSQTIIDLEESTEAERISKSQTIIDLEESTESERISNENAKHVLSLGCAVPMTYFGGKHQSQVSVQSSPIILSSVKGDPDHQIAESSCLVDDTECCQELNSFNQGFKESHNDIPLGNPSTKKQQFTSYEACHVDLNKVQLDDSSCYSNDPTVAYPSTASSSGGSVLIDRVQEGCCPIAICRKENNDHSNDTIQQDAVNLVMTNCNNKSKRTEIWARNSKLNGLSGSELSLIGLKSVSRPPTGIQEDLGNCNCDSKNEKDKLVLELQDGYLHDPDHTCVGARQVSCGKSEVDDTIFLCSDQSQNTIQDGHGKSHCIADNDSSSVKTIQSGIESGNADQFSGTHVGSQAVDTLSGEQDQRSSGSSELKDDSYTKKEESAEVDALIRKAAESLIHISLENSACYQDCSTKAGPDEMKNEERDQPQCSSDSFELIALKLTESSLDEYDVSSKPFEVTDTDKKDFGVKLRRGRRLKDFQRDILPSLASLSRHEIHEDISILEGVLRSREYRKIRARMAGAESWSAPVRSRRSRLNYLRRRKFS